MDLSHITSQSLRRILILTERKDELVDLVAEIETEIARVFFSGAATSPTKKAVAVRKAGKRSSSRKAGKVAPLRVSIPELLSVAGPKGIRVKDIAAKLGISGSRVSVWLGTTGKKLVSKVGPGVYALKGAGPAAAVPAKSAPSKKSGKAGRTSASSDKKAFKLSNSKRKN
jgi:hypothetical protein